MGVSRRETDETSVKAAQFIVARSAAVSTAELGP
jgi:hypothetical protein